MKRPDLKTSLGMILDGVLASEAIDSSGEIVKIDGMDISSMEDGEATANYEHKGKDSSDGRETVGRIIYVHKIFNKDDCEDERQTFYYNKMGQIPYLYGMVRLLDEAGHPGAESLAAQVRDAVAHEDKILVRYSVEGTTLKKEDNVIKECIARKVAMTLGPCNKTCFSGVILDPGAPEGFDKNPQKVLKADLLRDPLSHKISESEYEANPVISDNRSSFNKLVTLLKALTASTGDVAPSNLTGHQALQTEDLHSKYKRHIVKAIRDYNKPFDKVEFRKFLKQELEKAQLPEVSDSYLDHFTTVAQDYQIKKSVSYISLPQSLFADKLYQLESTLVDLRKSIRDSLQGYNIQLPEVYLVQLKIGGDLCPAGRFMVHNGQVSHLEDYHNLISSIIPEGPVDPNVVSNLYGLQQHPNFVITSHNPQEESPEAMVTPQQPPPRPAVFEYHRPGMNSPAVVEFTPNGPAIDGEPLTPDELSLIIQNAESGLATIKYRMVKHDGPTELDDLQETMNALRQAVKAGHIDPKHEKVLTQHLFEDHMVPGIGNKKAFAQHISQNKPGTYGSVDLNNFKHINDTHGHPVGDEAIKNIGGALKSAADKTGNIKLHRIGGDEFAVHAPDEGTMHQFIRHARSHMDSMPAIKGVHRPSFSIGLGKDYQTADNALLEAKKQKVDPVSQKALYHPQRTPHFGHSLLPGSEGPIKMS